MPREQRTHRVVVRFDDVGEIGEPDSPRPRRENWLDVEHLDAPLAGTRAEFDGLEPLREPATHLWERVVREVRRKGENSVVGERRQQVVVLLVVLGRQRDLANAVGDRGEAQTRGSIQVVISKGVGLSFWPFCVACCVVSASTMNGASPHSP